ncbi:hypothetical protein ABXS75_01975 [Roseburia hominis]
MKHKTQRRSNIFLMEIIISILFFSIASAVCIQLFAKAKLLSDNAAALNQAVLAASSAAEALEVCDGTPESLLSSFPDGVTDGQTLRVFYDRSWKPCDASSAFFQMEVLLSTDQGMLTGNITVTGEDEVIYTLQAEHYRGDD